MAIRLKNFGAKLLCLFIVSVLFIQCTFEPFEEYISPINPPETITVSFNINDPNFKNPYYLLEPTRLIFKLDNLSNAILDSEIKLNHSSINSNITNNGVEFILYPEGMENGNHVIHMTFKIDTKSGSLANKLGAEYYIVEQTFNVIIDTDPPVFNSFEAIMENGFLTFRWSETEKLNFVYKVKLYNSFGSILDSVLIDPQTNQFINRGYVGGHLYYQVLASGVGFEITVGSGQIWHTPVTFTLIKNAEGIAQLQWFKNNINLENVKLQIDYKINSPNTITIPLTSEGIINLGKMGLREGITVSTIVYRDGFVSHKSRESLWLDPIPNIKAFLEFKILKEQNKLLLGAANKIYRYDLDGFVLEDSLSLDQHGIFTLRSLVVTPDGTRAYVNNFERFISFDPLRFDNVSYHDLDALMGEVGEKSANISFLSLGNATDNGLISMGFQKGFSAFHAILDISNSKVLWHSDMNNWFVPILSHDGKYFSAPYLLSYLYYEGWIYRRDNGQYNKIGKIGPGDSTFLPGSAEVISYFSLGSRPIYAGEFLNVYNLHHQPQEPSEFFQSIRNAPIPPSLETDNYLEKITYDPFTNYIVFSYVNSIKLMNAATLEYEKTILGYRLLFSNNYILNTQGFIEAVQ